MLSSYLYQHKNNLQSFLTKKHCKRVKHLLPRLNKIATSRVCHSNRQCVIMWHKKRAPRKKSAAIKIVYRIFQLKNQIMLCQKLRIQQNRLLTSKLANQIQKLRIIQLRKHKNRAKRANLTHQIVPKRTKKVNLTDQIVRILTMYPLVPQPHSVSPNKPTSKKKPSPLLLLHQSCLTKQKY